MLCVATKVTPSINAASPRSNTVTGSSRVNTFRIDELPLSPDSAICRVTVVCHSGPRSNRPVIGRTSCQRAPRAITAVTASPVLNRPRICWLTCAGDGPRADCRSRKRANNDFRWDVTNGVEEPA